MPITAWRIFQPAHRSTAFTGEGARLYGGRWNSKGTSIVYTSSSISLAALEMLVHLHSAQLLLRYLVCRIEFDESLVNSLPVGSLPRRWRAEPAPITLPHIGDRWVASASSTVLAVPSAIIRSELNYLLNPVHPDFHRVKIGKPVAFAFDARLVR